MGTVKGKQKEWEADLGAQHLGEDIERRSGQRGSDLPWHVLYRDLLNLLELAHRNLVPPIRRVPTIGL